MIEIGQWHYDVENKAIEALPKRLSLFIQTNEGTYPTCLLPVLVGEEQWLLSGYCHLGGRGWVDDPRVIYAPRILLWMHYPSGEFRWEEPAPNAYGLLTAKEEGNSLILGPFQRDHLIGNEWYYSMIKYPRIALKVIENRWLVTAYPTTDEEQAVARELQQCVRAVYDAPLLPFYQYFGHHFLAWMERAAK